MLNLEFIENLYNGLTRDRQKELCTLLFKNSKQTMEYFKRTQTISLAKLEILADYFGLPLDAFRKNGQQKTNNVAGNNNYVGNISYSTTLMKENEALHKEIETLQSMISAKDEVIQAKNEVINALRFRISQEDGTIKT